MVIGQAAYEAYCGHTGWKSLVSGQDLPQWEVLDSGIKEAWVVAANAVIRTACQEFLRNFDYADVQ